MTRMVKNIVMVFTLIAAIFLIIFCVELFLLNRDAGDANEPTIALDPVEENGDNGENGEPYENGEQGPPEEPNGDIANGGEPILLRPQEGTRFDFPMLLPEYTLIAYADMEVFRLSESEERWRFIYADEGDATLDIRFDLITPPGGIRTLTSVVMEHLGVGQPRILGDRTIGNSLLSGYAALGQNDDISYEVWIHSLTGRTEEGIAVVFTMRYQDEEQREALHQIIDSLEMLSDEEDEE